MENLKALLYGNKLTPYQKGLAVQEFEMIQKKLAQPQLQELMDSLHTWSNATFGSESRHLGKAYHLKKEVTELIAALTKLDALGADPSVGIGEFARQLEEVKMEFADCFLLFLDSAQFFKLTGETLLTLGQKKLKVNQSRNWGTPDKNGVVEHSA